MIDINLIASRRALRQRTFTLMRVAFYGLFGLAILIVLMYAWLSVQIRFVASGIIEAEAILSAPDMQKNLERITFLEQEISELRPKAHVLQKVHDCEDRWIQVLQDIGQDIPANVWVTSTASRVVDKGQHINLSGTAASQELIGAYMLSLQGEEWAGPLQLVQANSNRSCAKGMVDFQLTIPLKEPIGVDLLSPEQRDIKKPSSQPAAAEEAGGE